MIIKKNITRRNFLALSAITSIHTLTNKASAAFTSYNHMEKVKIIAIEEHLNIPDLAQASMPSTLSQAPYLPNWGKEVDDLGELDPSRPRVIKASSSLQKLLAPMEQRILEMDEQGIDMQLLSYIASPQFILENNAIEVIQKANNHLTQLRQENPSRFAGFATLPWQNTELAIIELERCVKELGFTAVLINGRPSNDFLDHPRYEPILAKLSELNIPLFIHPGIPLPQVQQAYYSGFNNEVSARLSMFAWGWHNEAGIQVIRLMLSGIMDKYPNLKLISGHLGELVPYYLQRLDDSIPLAASGLQCSLLQTYREQVYVTNSGMTDMAHFNFIKEVVGIDNMLFSVDYPYLSLNGTRKFIEELPITPTEKAKFAHKNAEKLFKL